MISQPTNISKTKQALYDGVGEYSIIAALVGLLLLIGAFFLGHFREPWNVIVSDILRELGLVLLSVFGVSFLYEKLSAERTFQRFFSELQLLIRRGESNAAVCEALGVLQIYGTRSGYESAHHISKDFAELGTGDRVRVSGRSLIFTLYQEGALQPLIIRGGRLELCIFDPAIEDSPLCYMSGYSNKETALAVSRFVQSIVPGLLATQALGSVEVRFHQLHLLDSLLEIHEGEQSRVAWDLNFGQGTTSRQVLVLNAKGELGKNLLDRYDRNWAHAKPVFVFEKGTILSNVLEQSLS